MRLYRCDWPDGSVSFVLARTKTHAIDELDEISDARPGDLTEINDFMVHLQWKPLPPSVEDTGEKSYPIEWELEGFGECVTDDEGALSPELADACIARAEKFARHKASKSRP